MLDPLAATFILILVALLGARFSFSSELVPPGPRLLLRTGTHFLFVGLALGPVGLGLLGPEATTQLFPFLALGLGWIGFHFGLQLDLATLKRFPRSHHLFALGQAIVTLALFMGLGWLALRMLDLDGSIPLLLLAVAASTAAVTTPAGIALVSTNYLVRGKVRDLIFFVASLDAAIGVTALGVTIAIFRPDLIAAGIEAAPFGALLSVGVSVGLGLVCGIVFLWLVRVRPASEELVLFILGICAFSAGLALQWGLSPLFVSLTMGVVVANFGRSPQRVFAVLQKWEKPVYVTFLLVAGALLQPVSWWVLPLTVGYAVLRFIAKGTAGAVLSRGPGFDFEIPTRVGLALIPQGGISLAMAVSFILLFSGLEYRGVDAEALLFATIVLGVVLSELVGPFFTVRVLRRAGEISADVEAALAAGDSAAARKAAWRRPDS